jgi:antitoxin (DNA-binding transcriptional repressor) of toxin-antitoxin stability system
MKEIAIFKFKATCLAVLERVRKTGDPVPVTRFGHPIAQIKPVDEMKPSNLAA